MGFSGQEWGTHVNPWLIHVNVWQKPLDSPGKNGEHILIHVNIWQNPLQYCKVISLQLIKINEKKKKNTGVGYYALFQGIFLTQGSKLLIP